MQATKRKPYRAPALVEWRERGHYEVAVIFEPGYNGREGGPYDADYGVHGMQIRFVLRDAKGATQFLMACGWVPGVEGVPIGLASHYPSGWDLGYHALAPQYEGQGSMGPCDYLSGQECFYDGSSLRSDAVLEAFVREGERAVWRALQEEHQYRFGGGLS